MVSREEYLAAFEAYSEALKREGFALSDVEVGKRGLLTWAVGDASSPEEVARLDEIYDERFKMAERAYVREVFDRIYGADRHDSA